ncbi:PAP21, partial [Symbiodinium microadriaticum]
MFASTDSTDVTAYVRYGTDASNLDHVATAVGSTYSLRGYTSPMLYKATLVDLEDGNHVYYYSVGSDVAGYTEVMSFKSHPGVSVDDVTFFVIGDLGQTSNSETTIAELMETESTLTSLSGGIVNVGYPMQSAIEDTLYEYKVDIVFSGHVHAYERSCSLYQYVCQDGAPYYITIGDGGNKEGLATGWVEPQPDWSLFRQASYGFGKLRVVNSTHAQWSWHQNSDLIPTIADEYFFVKGGDSSSLTSGAARGAHRVTGEPMFVSGPRGDK